MFPAIGVLTLVGVAFAQAATPNFATLQKADRLSSNVIGVDIYNGAKEKIGKIHDVAFNEDNVVKAYILSVGGFMGMGTHYVAVDSNAVKIEYNTIDRKWHADMNVNKDELKAAPEFNYEGQWLAKRS
jgi:hypothetical protein